MADGSRSSLAENPVPPYLRWLLPSVADLIFIALLATLVFTPLAVRLLGDAGIGWHIRTGQQILATDRIPQVDPFSSTMGGKPWFAWEWLYDVIVGEVESSFGLNGVIWLTAVVIAATFGGLFHFLMRRKANLLSSLVLVLLATSASMIHFLARPHVVSWLLTLIWLWILDSTEWKSPGEFKRQHRIWLLPLLMLIWVNVHGGFLIGLALLGIYWLGSLWRLRKARANRIEEVLENNFARMRVRELTLVGLLSALATLINPYGWKLHEHIYSYLTNTFLINHIEEFQSPNFHGIAQKCFLILMLIAIATVLCRCRRVGIVSTVLLLFAIYSGLYASRNIPVAAIILVTVAGPLLNTDWEFGRRMGAVEFKLRGHLWPVAAIVVTFMIVASGGRLGSQQLMEAHFDPKRMPIDAVNYLASRRTQGPILGPDFWGGYLIYRLNPETTVVVDDRHDLYGAEFFKSYLTMMHVERGWEEFLRETHPGCVLLPQDSPLGSRFEQTTAWKEIYKDDVAIAFVPAVP